MDSIIRLSKFGEYGIVSSESDLIAEIDLAFSNAHYLKKCDKLIMIIDEPECFQFVHDTYKLPCFITSSLFLKEIDDEIIATYRCINCGKILVKRKYVQDDRVKYFYACRNYKLDKKTNPIYVTTIGLSERFNDPNPFYDISDISDEFIQSYNKIVQKNKKLKEMYFQNRK